MPKDEVKAPEPKPVAEPKPLTAKELAKVEDKKLADAVAVHDEATKAFEEATMKYFALPDPKPQDEINKYELVENEFRAAHLAIAEAEVKAVKAKGIEAAKTYEPEE